MIHLSWVRVAAAVPDDLRGPHAWIGRPFTKRPPNNPTLTGVIVALSASKVYAISNGYSLPSYLVQYSSGKLTMTALPTGPQLTIGTVSFIPTSTTH